MTTKDYKNPGNLKSVVRENTDTHFKLGFTDPQPIKVGLKNPPPYIKNQIMPVSSKSANPYANFINPSFRSNN